MKSSDTVLLRQWEERDLLPYAEMNADAGVMKYFPRVLSWDESRASMLRLREQIQTRGWGLWAVEVDGRFAGFTGLAEVRFSAPFTPCIEISWRFRPEFWGRGVALAAAREAERFAFLELGLPELVSFTAAVNIYSRRLMERLGFARDLESDFLHPLLPAESPLRLHVLYRRRKAEFDLTEQASGAS